MATTKPKLADVQWITVTMQPVTICDPPEGQACWLSKGSVHIEPLAAKRHALENPGHTVIRSAITRTQYCLKSPEVTA